MTIHKVFLVVGYDWEEMDIEKAYLSEVAAYQKAQILNTVSYHSMKWEVKEVEIGD